MSETPASPPTYPEAAAVWEGLGYRVEITRSDGRDEDPWLILERDGRRVAMPLRTMFGVMVALSEAVLSVEDLSP